MGQNSSADWVGLSSLQNALSLFLGRRRISKGSPFQVEEPTIENARRCLLAVLIMGVWGQSPTFNMLLHSADTRCMLTGEGWISSNNYDCLKFTEHKTSILTSDGQVLGPTCFQLSET